MYRFQEDFFVWIKQLYGFSLPILPNNFFTHFWYLGSVLVLVSIRQLWIQYRSKHSSNKKLIWFFVACFCYLVASLFFCCGGQLWWKKSLENWWSEKNLHFFMFFLCSMISQKIWTSEIHEDHPRSWLLCCSWNWPICLCRVTEWNYG